MLEYLKSILDFLNPILQLLKDAFGFKNNISISAPIKELPDFLKPITPLVNSNTQPIEKSKTDPIVLSPPPKYFKDVVARYGTPYNATTQLEDEAIKLVWEHEWMVQWRWDTFEQLTGLTWPTTAPFKKIYCNKDLIPYLNLAFKTLIEKDLFKELKIFNGCWCIRKIRGSDTKWSMHSFGAAVDFNSDENKLGEVGKFSQEFLQCWRDSGWTCGADFERRDFMHFQAVTNA